MIRPDLLRAKSLHAEVAYLQDLKRVGDAKRHEEQQNQVLRDKERRFWAETLAVKRSLLSPASVIGNSHAPTAGMQASAQLDRMHRAHSQLKEAIRSHSNAAQGLKDNLATLSGSQKRIEILDKLLAKAQRVRANQIESMLCEEVADLVTTSCTVLKLRGSRSTGSGSEDGSGLSLSSDRAVSGLDSEKAPEVTAGAEHLLLASFPQSHHVSAPVTTFTSGPRGQLSPIARATIPGPIVISDITMHTDQNQPCIALRCCLANNSTVGLRVSKSDGGGIKVLIDPSLGTVTTAVIKEKVAIQRRLLNMGINVAEIEIGASNKAPGLTSRSRRALLGEEDDESTIP